MPDIRHEIKIDAPPERVFAALSTERGFRGWWTRDVKFEPRVGRVAEFGFYRRAVIFRMKITALTPPTRMRWTCLSGPPEWKGTNLSFRLTPTEDGGTVLEFAHRDWQSARDDLPRANTVWGHLMFDLRDYVESGKPAPFFTT